MPPLQGPPGPGSLSGHTLTCPSHNARFDLRDGRLLSPPALGDLAVHEVKVERGKVWVRLGPSDGSRIMARLNPETEAVFAEARANRKPEERESIDAYRFDALVRVAERTRRRAAPGPRRTSSSTSTPPSSPAATPPQGVCEIKGVGPVPVATARELMGDALLTILVKKGVDVTTIAHDGSKTMPIAVRRAVLARDPRVRRRRLLRPHQRGPPRTNGDQTAASTPIHNCRGLCGWCHDLVHYHGYTLEPNGDGTYHLRAPPG